MTLGKLLNLFEYQFFIFKTGTSAATAQGSGEKYNRRDGSQLLASAQYHLRGERLLGSCSDYTQEESETTFSEFSAIHTHLFLNYTMLVNFSVYL